MTVKKSDFEVMEALTSDSVLPSNQNPTLNKQQCKQRAFLSLTDEKKTEVFLFDWLAVDSDLARSPPGSYEQDWPPTSPKEFAQSDKPPFLPPHLLNIILNKDTAAHVKFLFSISFEQEFSFF